MGIPLKIVFARLRATTLCVALPVLAEAAAIDHAAWQADYAALKHELEVRYEHLAWLGPAYIVTDGKTGSAAEMFTALAQDAGLAKAIGSHTMGDGCGFMGPVPAYAMPRAGLK